MSQTNDAPAQAGQSEGTKLSRREAIRSIARSATAAGLAMPGIVRAQQRSGPAAVGFGYLPANTILSIFAQGQGMSMSKGTKIEYQRFAGGPAIVNALVSGSLPVGEIGVGPALLAALRGAPLRFYTLGSIAGAGYPLSRIMVNADSDIRSFSDLRNRSLAIHQRGSMEFLSLLAGVKKYGVPLDDIKLSLVPLPNQPQVLAQKQVDAIYSIPPFDVAAEKNFKARTLVESSDYLPFLGYATLAVHESFASQNPELVKEIIRGWILAARWVNDNPAEAKKASGTHLGVPEDVAAQMRVPYYARNGLPVLANIWHIYQMYLEAKTIQPSPEIAQVIQRYFVEPAQRVTLPALREVGIQPDPVVQKFLTTRLPMLPLDPGRYFAPWDAEIYKV